MQDTANKGVPLMRNPEMHEDLEKSSAAEGISYPCALDEGERVIFIRDYKDGPVTCPKCRKSFVARKGEIREWHFAHKPEGSPGSCTREGVLHSSAKMLIKQYWEEAKRNKQKYVLEWTCPVCERHMEFDITKAFTKVETEHYIPGSSRKIRADLYFFSKSRPSVIEIVVSSDVRPDTEQAYLQTSIPVFKVYPTFELILETRLRERVLAKETLNTDVTKCPHCHGDKEELARRRAFTADIRRRLISIETPTRTAVPWTHYRDDKPIPPDTQAMLLEMASSLCRLGFEQYQSRPYNFECQTPIGTLYVYLNRSDIVSMRVESLTGMFLFSEHEDWQREAVGKETMMWLEKAGFHRHHADKEYLHLKYRQPEIRKNL